MIKDNGCLSGRTPRFIQPGILLLIYQKRSYGYEIIDNLKKNLLVETTPDPGIVYRMLRRMEKEGLVVSEWLENESGPAKRLYKITESGIENLIGWANMINLKVKTLNNFLNIYNDSFPKNKEEEIN